MRGAPLNQRQRGRRFTLVAVIPSQERQRVEVLGELRQQPLSGGFKIGRIVPTTIDFHQQLVRRQVVGGSLETLLQALDRVFLGLLDFQ